MKSAKRTAFALAVTLSLGGCASGTRNGLEQAASDQPTRPVATETGSELRPDAAVSRAEWPGTWIGVEGTYAKITLKKFGGYSLEMQSDLDTFGTYDGKNSARGIIFNRGGETLLLHAATGDETGLKYLAGKPNCLMVAEGEGYCRDE